MKDSSSYFDSDKDIWIKVKSSIDEDDVLHEGFLEYNKQQLKFCLVNDQLVRFSQKQIPYKAIPLCSTRVYVTNPQTLLLMRNSKSVSLKSTPQNIQFWFECLRAKVVLTDFLQHYDFGKLIGQGQFAQVYQVTSKKNTLPYAVKVFQKHQLKALNVCKESLLKEITILRTLKHQGVVKVYEVYEDKDCIYLVMELLQYSLKSVKQIFKEETAAKLMIQLFLILEFVHGHNIIHRDIKPDNILFKNESTLCLCDFGLADYYNPHGTYQFQRCGTPGFVAPEILRDLKYDHKVDVYSAGIILYCMMVGKQPFSAASQNEVVKKNYQAKIDFDVVKASPLCIKFMRQLLQDNHITRPSAYEALHHEWFIKTLGEVQYFSALNQKVQHLTNQMQQVSNFMAIQSQMVEEESEEIEEEPPLQQAINKYQMMIKTIQIEQQNRDFLALKEKLKDQHQQMRKN